MTQLLQVNVPTADAQVSVNVASFIFHQEILFPSYKVPPQGRVQGLPVPWAKLEEGARKESNASQLKRNP